MSMPDNPRAVIGDNESPEAPDYAKIAIERMGKDYGAVVDTVTGLLEEARALPVEIDNDETKGKFTQIIKRFRDLKSRLETFHSKEKEAPYRTGQGIDQFFFGLIDKCVRRDKKNKPGASDVLMSRLQAYDDRKLAEEQERRRKEAAEAARIAREAQVKADRERQEAEEARLAAERARKPETVEAKTVIADTAAEEASTAAIEAKLATDAAEAAHIETMAKPADLMRMRDAESGTLSTMGTEPYAEIIDRDKLDKNKLWLFLNEDAIAKALRAWAKTTGYTQQMDGAAIGKRNKSKVL